MVFPMKKLLFACALLLSLLVIAWGSAPLPPLEDGDIVLQTSLHPQSGGILIGTASLYSHMGIIKRTPQGPVVIEAAGRVEETPFHQWIRQGALKRITIYRYPGLSETQRARLFAAAKEYYGRPYDIFFSFSSDAIYCSELVYLAYKNIGLPLGAVQKVKALHFDNPWVKELIEQRWKRHPECKAKRYDFEQCYQHILEQELISPASIAADTRLQRIYSNYPF
jgi:hypothetical protein